MKETFTLKMLRDDMGSFSQPGCTSKDDALWHINSARDHDGLYPISMDDLESLLRGNNNGWAKFKPEIARAAIARAKVGGAL